MWSFEAMLASEHPASIGERGTPNFWIAILCFLLTERPCSIGGNHKMGVKDTQVSDITGLA